MAAIIFEQIVESNAVTIVALDDNPMSFLCRINGNIHPLSSVLYQMNREALRIERGPITA
jgi:hypothetical protein